MANKAVFASTAFKNHAGGKAFAKSDEETLVQFAMTGTFNDTYYTKGANQLTQVMDGASRVSDEFIAKLAIYGRQQGLMKDMPALLCAILVARQSAHVDTVFTQVIDNPRMLRNFVQMMRSGVVGRKSLGTKAKRLVQNFIGKLSDYALWEASIGNDPSLVDVMKLAHPKAKDDRRNALYAYILGRPVDAAQLPDFIREYEDFVKGDSKDAPLRAPFQKLTALPLKEDDWKRIALNASWTQTRLNLNTFARHGVFKDREMVTMLAERLSNRENVLKAKAFPYQLMAAMLNIDSEIPHEMESALELAMDVALESVPVIEGTTLIAVDISGSMSDPVTGRGGVPSKISCLQAAALIGSALLHKNRSAYLVAFNTACQEGTFPADQSVMQMAREFSAIQGGGTDCGSVLRHMNEHNIQVRNVILISDNESWADRHNSNLSALWAGYKQKVPGARMINLDITPNETSATANRADTLRVGGFSDEVFSVMSAFLAGNKTQLDAVKAVKL